MRGPSRWPWFTILLTAILGLNPFGLDILHAAFISGEQLSRNLWQPLVFAAISALLLLALLEWFVRRLILKRRARGRTIA